MTTVIGLGSAGCNIAELFEMHKGNFEVKLIDVDIEGENCFSLVKQQSPEDYEKNFPDLSNFLSDCREEVILILCGAGNISGCSLSLLRQIKDKKINILYIRPDIELIGNISIMQERVVFNVLQEYTRSGLFNSMTIIGNKQVENHVGDVTVVDYFKKINNYITGVFIPIKYLENTNGVFQSYSPPKDISRIMTVGSYEFEVEDTEQILYPLTEVDDKCYHFVINQETLSNDGKLFKSIREKMRKKSLDNVKVSYIIHPTSELYDYCYVTLHSRKIQE
jgi:hypothetical protein